MAKWQDLEDSHSIRIPVGCATGALNPKGINGVFHLRSVLPQKNLLRSWD